jgi:hypothetical protein
MILKDHEARFQEVLRVVPVVRSILSLEVGE